ncbi:MAG TPA: ATP-binding cassette domain-containing protein [Mycobacteriales bacterium]
MDVSDRDVATPTIELREVGKRYPDGTVAVAALDLSVAEGELVALIGPSGCGKTTTLKMLNRLIDPTSGQILLAGEDISTIDPVRLRRRIGYVIQNVGLFPHQDIRTNVASVPRLLGWPRARTRARVDELIELVGLDPSVHGGRYPAQLSGGQRQRVGVARALAADPPVLLMDEPFSAIDPIARDNLQQQFLRIQREVRKTVVMVTHDVDEAVLLADRIAVFREGGHLEQYAPPAQVLGGPATPFVEQFVGGDRALRRLTVTTLAEGDLLPRRDGAEARVSVGDTLHTALATILRTDAGWVEVVDGDGTTVVGSLGPEEVFAASRRDT